MKNDRKLFSRLRSLLPVLLAVFLFSALLALGAGAGDVSENPRLIDQAGLLQEQEAVILLSHLDEMSEELGFDIAVVTLNEEVDATPEECADYLYESLGYGFGDELDGVMLYINMFDRKWHITTTGYGITALTDGGLEYVENCFIDYLRGGEYYSAFYTYALACHDLVADAKNGNIYDPYAGGYDYDYRAEPLTFEEKLASYPWGNRIIIFLIIGFVISLIAVSSMKSKLKSVRSQAGAAMYTEKDSLNVRESRETFLYRNVSRTRIDTDSGSRSGGHGGSTTHVSHGGVSHGGRGGSF